MASTRQREGRFTGLYRDQLGAQRSAGTFKTQAAALKAALQHEAVEQAGRDAKTVLGKPQKVYRAEKGNRPTVAGYAPSWLAKHRLEPTSRESYGCMMKHIITSLGNIALHDLDHDKVQDFIDDLEASDLSGATVGHVLTVLREMCKSAVRSKLMEDDPTAEVKVTSRKNKTMRILTPEEYKRLLIVVPEYYALLVKTLVNTGLRWGEASGLKRQDIKPRGNGYVITVARVIIEVSGKPGERDYGKTATAMRDITISRELGEELLAREGDYVFRARRGGYLSRANFRRIWVKALSDAGIQGVRVHDLRHTHASWLANNGCNLVYVRDRLGHTDIKTTSRYLHVVAGEEDPAVGAMERALAA